MINESSSQAVTPSPQSVQRPPSIFGRVDAVMVGWFFVWPVVFFACLSLVTPGDTLEACLSVAGSLLWLLSCYWICGMLFAMAVARWPGATTIRKILSFVVDLLRAFQGHHPP